MLMYLYENNKQKLNFIYSFECLKLALFIFYNLFILICAEFAFSIAQAQTVIQNDFERAMQELLDAKPEIQTKFVNQNNFEKNAVKEVEDLEKAKRYIDMRINLLRGETEL